MSYIRTPEIKLKQSLSMRGKMIGNKNPAKRPEVREKIRLSKLGVKRNITKEWRDKINKSLIGNKHTLGYKYPKEVNIKKGLKGCKNPRWKGGKPKCKNCGKITANYKAKLCQKCYTKSIVLEKNPNWKNGKSFEPYTKEFNEFLKEKIRERDGYKCQLCGVPQQECLQKLSIHHIDYDKKNTNINNLISLCKNCHLKTNGNRIYWINIFKEKMKIGLMEII